MSDQDEEPEYLRNLAPEERKNSDNFGPEDYYWPGKDGNLDSKTLLDKHGLEWDTNLDLLLKSLIKAQSPEADEKDILDRTRKAQSAILGETKKGSPHKDDGYAMLQIAWACHQLMHENNTTDIKYIELRPIVRHVVEKFFHKVPTQRNIELVSYIEGLENKFIKNSDLYLSRATRYKEWERTIPFKKLKEVGVQLNALGIPCDTSVFNPRRLKRD